MEHAVHDPQSGAAITAAILKRIEAERHCPGITVQAGKNFRMTHFTVGDSVYADVRIAEYPGAGRPPICYVYLIEGPHTPAVHLTVSEGEIDLTSSAVGSPKDAVARALIRLTHGPICQRIGVPYGVVTGGIVTHLSWIVYGAGSVEGALSFYGYNFTLEGHDIPPELVVGPKDDSTSVMKRFWSLMRQGRIVELDTRLMIHPGTMWYLTSRVDWPYVMFDHPDGGTPLLPAGKKYLLRSPRDPIGSDLAHTRQAVLRTLQGGQAPIDLKEVFQRQLY